MKCSALKKSRVHLRQAEKRNKYEDICNRRFASILRQMCIRDSSKPIPKWEAKLMRKTYKKKYSRDEEAARLLEVE